jgi:4-hydroxy-tetrahydrodipicolinate reductase
MIDITLVGACGRMGKRIAVAIDDSEDTRISGAVEYTGHEELGRDIGEVAGLQSAGVTVTDQLPEAIKDAGAVIDFALPESAVQSAKVCLDKKVPLVTGVTGLNAEQVDVLERAAAEIAVVWAPNMSVGVNLMFKVAGEVARVLGDDFDVEIFETHHRFKRDAPSGTAKRLAEVIADALGRDMDEVGCWGRKGITGERDRKEIAVHSLRSGDVVGEHTAVFGTLGERFEITHRAHSRDTFARGAVVAARFAAQAAPGLYDMQDVLGLR